MLAGRSSQLNLPGQFVINFLKNAIARGHESLAALIGVIEKPVGSKLVNVEFNRFVVVDQSFLELDSPLRLTFTVEC